MMTNAQLYNRILVKARRAGDTNLRQYILSEMTEILQQWERSPFHPWFLETTSSGLVTTADEQTMDLPEDFLLQVEDTKVRITDSEGNRTTLARGYHEDLEATYDDEDPSIPEAYDIYEDKMWFGPIPDDEYEVRLKYYRSTTPPPDDASNVSNPWALKAQGMLVSAVAERLARTYLQNVKLADELANEVATARIELHKYNEARKHTDMDYEVDR